MEQKEKIKNSGNNIKISSSNEYKIRVLFNYKQKKFYAEYNFINSVWSKNLGSL